MQIPILFIDTFKGANSEAIGLYMVYMIILDVVYHASSTLSSLIFDTGYSHMGFLKVHACVAS